MTEQEVKIKMAEMLGWEKVTTDEYWNRDWYSEGDFRRGTYESIEYLFKDEWNPRKNLQQAMEVLEALRKINGDNLEISICSAGNQKWFTELILHLPDQDTDQFGNNQGLELKEAIFQAVKSYLEGER